MVRTRARLIALVTLGLAACGTTASGGDAVADAAADSAATDAATVDAATADAAADAGATDVLAVDVAPDAAPADVADAQGTDAGLPDTGLADTGPADTGTTDTGPAVPYANVQAVFDARCTNCHSATALGLPGFAKLPLTSDVSYATLVNKPANAACGGTLVVPGSPATSFLWQKISSDTPCEGSRMPAKFEVLPAPPLTADQLTAIHDWIAGGAPP